MKPTVLATAFAALTAGTAFADGHLQAYTLDPAHSAIQMSWGHGDFSSTYGMFFEVNGEMMIDFDNPENTTVSISVPLEDLVVDPTLKGHLASDNFFGGYDGKMVEFTSTSVNVTGENTAEVTGDLTIAGATSEVTIDTVFNARGAGPTGGEIAGFTGSTTILRSDFGIDWFTPFVSDAVAVEVSIEASPAS
ncbi:MAG: YceI family protein [Pseudomonadota bacterium]